MPYVDGFLLSVPKKKVSQYVRVARQAGKLWKKHGALEYRETVGDDLKNSMGTPFTKAARSKPGETPVFSWIVYKSKAHRDSVNKKVMKDPHMKEMMEDPRSVPFDIKRMSYGGFKVAVDL